MEDKSENNVEIKVRPQNKHLKPIKKGERLNPNGRPNGQRNYATIYREALIKLGQANGKTADELETELVQAGFANARKGDYRFYKDVLDRAHGQAETKIVIETNEESKEKAKLAIKELLNESTRNN